MTALLSAACGRYSRSTSRNRAKAGATASVHDTDDPFARRRVVLGDRGERRRLLCRHRDDALHLRDGALDDRPRRHDAGRDPLARDLGARLQVAREGAESLLVALEMLGRVGPLDRRDVSERDARPHEVVGHVETVGPELDHREGLRRDRLEDVHRRAERDVEALAVDRGELVEGGTVPGLRQRAAFLADVGETVVVAFVADRRGEDRLTFEQLFPEAVGERLCAVGIVHVGSALSVGVTGGQAYPRRRPATPRRR